VSGPQVGSAAEEAAKLLGAAEQWVRARAGSLLDDEHLATGAPECTTCPVCQTVGTLRQVRPETVDHLLDAAASLVAALQTAVAPPGAAPRRSGGVEHIDVTEGQQWD
jgi:hypothetical protein